MRRLIASLAGAGIFALAACSPAAEEPVAAPESVSVEAEAESAKAEAASESAEQIPKGFTVNGEVTWTGELPALDQPRLIVEIYQRGPDGERSMASSSAPVEGGPPLSFHVLMTAQPQDVMDTLILRARLQDGYAILLATDGDIDLSGGTSDLDIALYNPEDIVRGRTGQMITPAGMAYACGGEAMTIAIEAGAAYVTFADGTSVKLDKLETAGGAATQFTNGRFLVEQSGEEIRFGRGRAVPQACTAS